MTLLIYAGLLYLLGISIVLAIKPEFMFKKDGNWKEFGLGRSREHYTWLPFWLFAIGWAIISYTLILVIASHTGLGGVSTGASLNSIATEAVLEPENVSTKSMAPAFLPKKKPTSVEEMKPGYYILDANETVKQGIPKYIFLGPQSPHVIYHNQMEDGIWKME